MLAAQPRGASRGTACTWRSRHVSQPGSLAAWRVRTSVVCRQQSAHDAPVRKAHGKQLLQLGPIHARWCSLGCCLRPARGLILQAEHLFSAMQADGIQHMQLLKQARLGARGHLCTVPSCVTGLVMGSSGAISVSVWGPVCHQ